MNTRLPFLSAWITVAVTLAIAGGVMLRAHLLWQAEFLETTSRIRGPVRAAPGERAVVKIDFGNGTQRMFEGSAPIFFHPLDGVLRSVGETGGFGVTVRDGRIVELAGINGTLGGRWQVYRGQEPVRDPVDRVVIRNGEKYVIRYEK